MNRLIAGLALITGAWVTMSPVVAQATQLLMLVRPGCVYCDRWDAEIGPAYPNTEEGRQAPLRRVDITEPWPDDLEGIRRETYTPTFIVMDGKTEIGRLRGYPGDEFFWFLLGEILEKTPKTPATGS